uniref:C2H2-type domain-containing protein n=1 Tax=Spongospora subterranea TaxID=70186 RepID=A0A0H5R4W1_9EUKA|eukprot:CRZ09225.1 hypothetical protein [Spongospora subterranea]
MLRSGTSSPTLFLQPSTGTQQSFEFDHAVSDDIFDLLPSSLLTLPAFFRQYEPRLLEFVSWFQTAGFVLVRDLYGMTGEERRHLYSAVSNPPMPYSLQIRLERLIVIDMGLTIAGKNASTQTYPNAPGIVIPECEPDRFTETDRDCVPMPKSLTADKCTQWVRPGSASAMAPSLGDSQGPRLTIDGVGRSTSNAEEEEGRLHGCPKCSMTFTRRDSLTVHYRSHTGERPFPCSAENCSMSFRSKTALLRHAKIHNQSTDVSCDFCSKTFKTLSALNKHRVVHLQVKPYQCEVCCRPFRRKDHLEVHQMIHSSEKLFQCDLCPRRFKQKSGLTFHRRSHEPRFSCKLCTKQFQQQRNLDEHVFKHHLPT